MCAVTEMHALQHADTIHSSSVLNLAHGQRIYTPISDPGTFHQPYPLKLWQPCKLRHAVIGKVCAASQVNISDPVACFRKCLDRQVSNAIAVAEMNVMQVLAQFRDGEDSSICDLSAFCQDQIAQARTALDDLFNSSVSKLVTVG